MRTVYYITAVIDRQQRPTFVLDANVQGVTSPQLAARIALDVLTGRDVADFSHLLSYGAGHIEGFLDGRTVSIVAVEGDFILTAKPGQADGFTSRDEPASTYVAFLGDEDDDTDVVMALRNVHPSVAS